MLLPFCQNLAWPSPGAPEPCLVAEEAVGMQGPGSASPQEGPKDLTLFLQGAVGTRQERDCVEGRLCWGPRLPWGLASSTGRGTQMPSKDVDSICFGSKAKMRRTLELEHISFIKKCFSLKKTNCDREKKESQLQMGPCFIQDLCRRLGRWSSAAGWESGTPQFQAQSALPQSTSRLTERTPGDL